MMSELKNQKTYLKELMKMLTDSHAHILKEYYNDFDKVISDAKALRVTRIINNGCDQETNEEVLELIQKYPNMFGAIGIHPESVAKYKDEDLKFIENNIYEEKIIAIGEIGLDYHYSKEDKEQQIQLFESQLRIAEKNNIPIIVHSREATLDTLTSLKKFNCRGIIHSFGGSYETALEYIKLGYLIGINGVITFKNSHLKEVIVKLPLDSLVLETDSPYLTPHPFRGEQNSPKHIWEIAQFVADLFNITVDDLAQITNQNLMRIFDKLS